MGVRILDDVRLVWDRLPMTIVFMSLLAALVAERINVRVGVWLMPFLLFIGVASVLQWRVSELRAAGDLRFYAAVQLYSIPVSADRASAPLALHARTGLEDCGGLLCPGKNPGGA
jgi:hypothetical protein